MKIDKRHVAYQVKGKIKKKAYPQLDEVIYLSRRLYNAALQESVDTYRNAKRNPHLDFPKTNYFHQQKELTGIREDDERYRAIAVQIMRGVLQRKDRAMQDFFRRVTRGEIPGFPRFQGRGRYTCIEAYGVWKSWLKTNEDRTKGRITIKGLPIIRFTSSRPLPDDKFVALRVHLTPNGIWIDLVFECEIETLPKTGNTVGIDCGITQRLTLSNGEHVERRKLSRKRERQLQRKASRSKKGSKNRQKCYKAVARERRRNKIRNRNECHRITSKIVKENDFIAAEHLKITNMTRSAKGTEENPGTNVSAKRGLNREIQTQTWGIIRSQLSYKAEWAGRQYVEVDPQYTSQTCSTCGEISAKSRRSQSNFDCISCGFKINADVNAARNILRRALLAEGRDFCPRIAKP